VPQSPQKYEVIGFPESAILVNSLGVPVERQSQCSTRQERDQLDGMRRRREHVRRGRRSGRGGNAKKRGNTRFKFKLLLFDNDIVTISSTTDLPAVKTVAESVGHRFAVIAHTDLVAKTSSDRHLRYVYICN